MTSNHTSCSKDTKNPYPILPIEQFEQFENFLNNLSIQTSTFTPTFTPTDQNQPPIPTDHKQPPTLPTPIPTSTPTPTDQNQPPTSPPTAPTDQNQSPTLPLSTPTSTHGSIDQKQSPTLPTPTLTKQNKSSKSIKINNDSDFLLLFFSLVEQNFEGIKPPRNNTNPSERHYILSKFRKSMPHVYLSEFDMFVSSELRNNSKDFDIMLFLSVEINDYKKFKETANMNIFKDAIKKQNEKLFNSKTSIFANIFASSCGKPGSVIICCLFKKKENSLVSIGGVTYVFPNSANFFPIAVFTYENRNDLLCERAFK